MAAQRVCEGRQHSVFYNAGQRAATTDLRLANFAVLLLLRERSRRFRCAHDHATPLGFSDREIVRKPRQPCHLGAAAVVEMSTPVRPAAARPEFVLLIRGNR